MGLTYPNSDGVTGPYSPLERDCLKAVALARQALGRDPRQNEVVARMRKRWHHLGPVVLGRLVHRGRLATSRHLMPRFSDTLADAAEVLD